jgi:hypothetical protein
VRHDDKLSVLYRYRTGCARFGTLLTRGIPIPHRDTTLLMDNKIGALEPFEQLDQGRGLRHRCITSTFLLREDVPQSNTVVYPTTR